MRNYVYSMTGCGHWFELAMGLHERGICSPVLWLGDGRHKGRATGAFGNCNVLDLDQIVWFQEFGSFKADKRSTHEFASFMETENFPLVKLSALKIMDRLDNLASFSRPHREAVFERTLLFLIHNVCMKRIDFGLFIENPHSYPQFLLKEFLIHKNIPVFYFSSATFGPFLKLLSPNFDLPPIKGAVKENYEFESYYKDLIEREIFYEPDYMKKQRIQNSKIDLVSCIKLLKRNLGDFVKKREYYFDASLNWLFYRFFQKRNLYKKLLKKYRQASQNINLSQFPKYVYFPLHYEPERTTLPDGGLTYHNQTAVLLKLCQLFPNFTIIVKEHPTQLYNNFRGWRSRSDIFYRMLGELPNVVFIDNETTSLEIINNASFVATVTGTVAIEAALSGIPAVIFGEAWYKGCPGTVLISQIKGESDILNVIPQKAEVLNFLKTWEEESFRLSINRSWEGRFNESLNESELRNLCEYIKHVLNAI